MKIASIYEEDIAAAPDAVVGQAKEVEVEDSIVVVEEDVISKLLHAYETFALSSEHDSILQETASSAVLKTDWKSLRIILGAKIYQVLQQYFKEKGFVGPITESFESRRNQVLILLESFDYQPPFTIQRLAEVLTDPTSQFVKTHKLINSIEKLLSVSSPPDNF